MRLHYRTEIREVRLALEIGGYAHGDLHYDGYNGRRLALSGQTNIRGGPRPRSINTQLDFYPSSSHEAKKHGSNGFARVWPSNAEASELLTIAIDLELTSWTILWDQSSSGKWSILVNFEANDWLEVGQYMPIFDPKISFGLNLGAHEIVLE